MWPLLQEQLPEALGSLPLRWHYLTHSHFDHIGCTPHLIRRYPSLAVGAHPYLGEVLKKPRAVERIRMLNEPLPEGVKPFQPFALTARLQEGDKLDLGGVEVEVWETPGHTRDSLSFYLPEPGFLIPGEAAGVPDLSGRIHPEFTQDYRSYVENIHRFREVPLVGIGLPHWGVVWGKKEVRAFLEKSLKATEAFFAEIAQGLKRFSPQELEERLSAQYYDPEKMGQPYPAFRLNLQAMIQVVARVARGEENS